MRRATIFLLTILAMSSFSFAQEKQEFEFYIPSPDTLFVLPGEAWFLQHGVGSTNSESEIISLRANLFVGELNQFGDHEIWWQTHEMGRPDWQLYDGSVYLSEDYYRHQYNWLANTSSSGLNFLYLVNLSATNNLPVGQVVNYYLNVEIGTQKFQSFYPCLTRTLLSIDGIRGDVNADGTVDENDVEALAYYSSSLEFYGRYSQGFNYGRGMILFNCPDIISTALVNIWVHNPNDLLVQGLEIGELMSGRLTNSVQLASISSALNGEKLTVYTDGNVVNITTIMPDGKLWQKTEIVTNGQLTVDVPDEKLNYKIEAVKLEGLTLTSVQDLKNMNAVPTEFSLSQNYPNPFNPSTTISFSLPVSANVDLKVYNVAGQVIKTLMAGQLNAGSHQIQWDGTDVNGNNAPSGVYFYKLQAGEFNQTCRMQLLK